MSHSEGIRRGLSVWLSGHVAYSEGFRRGSLGVGFRNTWHAPKDSEGVSRCGLSGHLARSEGFRRGGSWFGHSGHVAHSEDIRGDSPGTCGELGRLPEGSLCNTLGV